MSPRLKSVSLTAPCLLLLAVQSILSASGTYSVSASVSATASDQDGVQDKSSLTCDAIVACTTPASWVGGPGGTANVAAQASATPSFGVLYEAASFVLSDVQVAGVGGTTDIGATAGAYAYFTDSITCAGPTDCLVEPIFFDGPTYATDPDPFVGMEIEGVNISQSFSFGGMSLTSGTDFSVAPGTYTLMGTLNISIVSGQILDWNMTGPGGLPAYYYFFELVDTGHFYLNLQTAGDSLVSASGYDYAQSSAPEPGTWMMSSAGVAFLLLLIGRPGCAKRNA